MKPRAWLRDPVTPSLLLFMGLVVGGFIAVGLGWRVAARNLTVAFQTPALVSGGMGGLALIILGVSLVNIQVGRRLAAAERAETEALLDEASMLVAALKDRQARRRES